MYLRDWYHNENALLVNLPGPVIAKFDLDSLTLTQLSNRISRCIGLDFEDNVYINQTSKILKLTNKGVESIFWQPQKGEINHLYINGDGLMVELDTQQAKQLLKINFDKKTRLKYLPLELGEGWLSDVSSDGNQLLSMIRSNVDRTIFTLQ